MSNTRPIFIEQIFLNIVNYYVGVLPTNTLKVSSIETGFCTIQSFHNVLFFD